MKFGIVVFPGSNCDHDTAYVLGTLLGLEVEMLWHKDTDLKGCDFIILPGGFSYGDYLRSGAIARFSPIMDSVISFANNGGYVLGICNGFQILCEAGLTPGVLLHNTSRKFICKNVHITAATTNTLLTQGLTKGEALKVPIAHGEGNYYFDAENLKVLEDNDQIIFRYCDENGDITPESNPNGSINNIAGVCNASRNVFGLMPHPERAADPLLSNTDGLKIFESLLGIIAEAE